MRFGILGPLEVTGDDGRPVAVAGVKERALLALLLIDAGRVVPADRLIDDLWGEHPPGNPANALQARVSQLRRALGPGAVAHRTPGYVLDVPPDALDAAEFERLTRAAGDDPGQAAALLTRALGLWRGPAYAEFASPSREARRCASRSSGWPPRRTGRSCCSDWTGWPRRPLPWRPSRPGNRGGSGSWSCW